MHINQIYTNAIELKKNYNNNTNEKEIVFLNNFKHDYKIYFVSLQLFIIHTTINTLSYKNNYNYETKFKIFNICKQKMVLDYCSKYKFFTNIKIKTFFTGFWNPYEKTFNSDIFNKCNLDLMLVELNKHFLDNNTGIYLTDISNSEKSFNHVILVTVQPKPN